MSRQRSTRKSFVTYRLKNGWTDFQVFGVCGFIWLPWVFMAHIGLPQVPGKPPPPRFLFLAKPFWQLTKWTCHTFWRKWLNRFEWGIRWKVWNTQMLSYTIWVTYAETPWGAAHSPFYYFEKRCRHLLVGKWSLTLSFLSFRTLLAWLSPATICFFVHWAHWELSLNWMWSLCITILLLWELQ